MRPIKEGESKLKRYTVSLVMFAEPEILLGFQAHVRHLGKTGDGSQRAVPILLKS